MWPVCLALVALAVYLRYLSCCTVLKWVLCIKGATQLNKILSKRPQKLRVRSVLIHLDCAFCVRLNLIFQMNWLCVLLLYRSTSTAYRRANLWFVSATRQEISLASTWETALLICWCVETKTGGRTQKCTLWHWWRWRSRTRTVPPNTQNLTVGANRTEAEKSDCSIVFPQWHRMKEEAEATVHWRTGVRKVCVRRQALFNLCIIDTSLLPWNTRNLFFFKRQRHWNAWMCNVLFFLLNTDVCLSPPLPEILYKKKIIWPPWSMHGYTFATSLTWLSRWRKDA